MERHQPKKNTKNQTDQPRGVHNLSTSVIDRKEKKRIARERLIFRISAPTNKKNRKAKESMQDQRTVFSILFDTRKEKRNSIDIYIKRLLLLL
jgi:ribosomal protein L20